MQQKQKEENRKTTAVYKSFCEPDRGEREKEEQVFCSYCGIKNSRSAKQCSHCKAPINK
ncbi:MAG: hypothetical protein FWG51_03460 [Firmicutes bacterium]|nr:hypothetical protein [Bacillota bacterium]